MEHRLKRQTILKELRSRCSESGVQSTSLFHPWRTEAAEATTKEGAEDSEQTSKIDYGGADERDVREEQARGGTAGNELSGMVRSEHWS